MLPRPALGAPASVTVAIGEVIADVREGLLAMAAGAGLQVMAAMMSEDVTLAWGPNGKHDPDRVATRRSFTSPSLDRPQVGRRSLALSPAPPPCRTRHWLPSG
jgi:hypothetical protein